MALTCGGNSAVSLSPQRTSSPADEGMTLVEPIYDRGLKGQWQDWGWSRRELSAGAPARVQLSNYGGWVIARPGWTGAITFEALVFRIKAPRPVDFLEAALSAGENGQFPGVRIAPAHLRRLNDGWLEARVGMEELNPARKPYDRVVLRAYRPMSAGWVEVDAVGFWRTAAANEEKQAKAKHDGPSPAAGTQDTDPLTHAAAARRADLQVQCTKKGHTISPLIYGIAYYPHDHGKDGHVWQMGPAIRRWGGNHTSRYNWKLGNAWNTANDWFFRNVNFTGKSDYHWSEFLDENRRHNVLTAITVPMIGWAAKDTTSHSFPVSIFGPQQSIDPHQRDAGNGIAPNGSKLEPGSPTRTSVEMSPQGIEDWVRTIRARDQDGGRSVHIYLLDNEPMIWHVTHRDVHPRPVGYDELLERTIAYATAIRRADPQALIAGPNVWGWPAYFFSAIDAAAGFHFKPDRRSHGDVPLLEWYLRKLKEHETKTGVRLLDILNVHFYPQGDALYGPNVELATQARRLRATRALWDRSYRDESWVGEVIQLLPRMQRIIDENYPTVGFSIGEWNFGAEEHMNGALALAEALGRFGQHPGMAAAFYWTYPRAGTPAFHAFRAFRNYDGKQARFRDVSVPTNAADGVSLFASRDPDGKTLVAVALNLDPTAPVEGRVALEGCGSFQTLRSFRYEQGKADLVPVTTAKKTDTQLLDVLPPYSITVYELGGGDAVVQR